MSQRQILFLDADDTLWENNIYFERAIERFYDLLTPACSDRIAVRAEINRQERRVITEIGYGLATFRLALERACEQIAPQAWSPETAEAIGVLAGAIAGEPIQFLPGALETLQYLASRHRLILLTKGDYAEQTHKVALSGIAPLFEQVHVLPEKNRTAYEVRLRALAVAPACCWMIGNSPKSDINPALAAGMNAVLIPHPHTWVLEHEAIVQDCAPGCRCLTIERLADLRALF
ncbi:MAG: HAD family hydrolase [Terriglobales bacterium]